MTTPIITFAKENFLPTELIMVDCEMTGVHPKNDDLLQVAMTRLVLKGTQYVEEGEPLDLYLHCDKQPSNKFQKEFLTEIFKKCNESTLTPEQAKEKIEAWLGDLLGKATPVGDCVIADLRFLYEKGLISENYYEGDTPVPGTFHYEIFDLNGVKSIARTLWGEKRKPENLDANIHNALVDCRNQTLELNQYLETFFGSRTESSLGEEYSKDDMHTVFASNLPDDIAPSVEVNALPPLVGVEDLEMVYGDLMLATDSFEQMQGLINQIMLEKGITEEYRVDLAGVINQYRLEHDLTAF